MQKGASGDPRAGKPPLSDTSGSEEATSALEVVRTEVEFGSFDPSSPRSYDLGAILARSAGLGAITAGLAAVPALGGTGALLGAWAWAGILVPIAMRARVEELAGRPGRGFLSLVELPLPRLVGSLLLFAACSLIGPLTQLAVSVGGGWGPGLGLAAGAAAALLAAMLYLLTLSELVLKRRPLGQALAVGPIRAMQLVWRLPRHLLAWVTTLEAHGRRTGEPFLWAAALQVLVWPAFCAGLGAAFANGLAGVALGWSLQPAVLAFGAGMGAAVALENAIGVWTLHFLSAEVQGTDLAGLAASGATQLPD